MLIIHTADVHLGANPDAAEPWGKNRKQELWDSFERLLERTRQERADLLLIAGDLFHRPPLLRELREIRAMFAELKETQIALIAGNHDFIGENSFYREFSWPENVHFLKSDRISSVKIPELKVEIYGASYHQREIRERLYDGIRPENNGYYHILLAHGGDEKHIPFTREKLAGSGFDYIAFGHIHKPGMILPDQAVMAGSLEPTDHTCRGVHGYVRVETAGGRNHIVLVPFAKREYKELELLLTPEDTMQSIFRRTAEEIEKRGKDHIYDVKLLGTCHSSLRILEEKLKTAGNIRIIHDETEVSYDYESLSREYDGRLLQRYITSFDGCESPLEKKALSIGTAAILEALGL